MSTLLIEGGQRLSGAVDVEGNKNAALPLLACSLLTAEEVVLHNVPIIRDVQAMLELLADLGVRVERRDDNTVALKADGAATAAEIRALIDRCRGAVRDRFGVDLREEIVYVGDWGQHC